jgi:hypothetical protein
MYPDISVNLLGSARRQRRIRQVHFLPRTLIAFSYFGHGVSQFIVLLAAMLVVAERHDGLRTTGEPTISF